MNPVLYDELHDALSDIYEAMMDNGHDELYGLEVMQVEEALDELEMEEKLNPENITLFQDVLEIRRVQLNESLNSTVGLSEEDVEYFEDAIALVEKAILALNEVARPL
jgi:hypothetical protein